MIRCNLAVLLAERDLKITKVSADTGISRTTLTSLSSNNCQGIQLDTLNKLCIYLNVSPNDIFLTLPFSIICKEIQYNKTDIPHIFDLEILLEVNLNQKNLPIYLYATMYNNTINPQLDEVQRNNLEIYDIEIETSFKDKVNSKFSIKENTNLKYLKLMPIYFLNDLKEDIVNYISQQFHLNANNIDFSWPDELITMKTNNIY